MMKIILLIADAVTLNQHFQLELSLHVSDNMHSHLAKLDYPCFLSETNDKLR